MGIVSKEKKNYNGVIIENLHHDSNSLLKTSYNYTTKQLRATFKKGTVYSYDNVPVDVYEGLKKAESTGSYFNKEIVKQIPSTKISTVDEETLNQLKTVINDSKK